MLHRDRVAQASLPVRRIFLFLMSIAGALVIISCLVLLGGPLDPSRRNLHITLFDVSAEQNVPSWFSAALWLMAGLSCMICAFVAVTRRGQWVFLGMFCIAFSLDETVSLHENILAQIGDSMLGDDRPEFRQWSWVVPGAIVALAVAAVCLRLIWSLPHIQRRLVILAGAIFVTGALVIETVSHAIDYNWGTGAAYILANGLEEGLEMLGVILFLCTILSLLQVQRYDDRLEIWMLTGTVSARSAADIEGTD